MLPGGWRRITERAKLAEHELDQSISTLPGIGPSRQAALGDLGVHSVRDVLFHVPRGYWERGKIVSIADAQAPDRESDVAVVEGVVRSSRANRRGRRSWALMKIEDESGSIEALFFNQGYLSKSIRRGARIWVSGRVDRGRERPRLIADRHGRVDDFSDEADDGLLRIARYELPETVPAATWRRAVSAAIDVAQSLESDPSLAPSSVQIPGASAEGVDPKDDVSEISLVEALRVVHIPSTADGDRFVVARRRIAYEELLALAISLQRSRTRFRATTRPGLAWDGENCVDALIERLPFSPTRAQTKAVGQILSDLAGHHPMHRLLQGDVGSGKTAVAQCALLAVALADHRAAMLVPTGLLAGQHADTLEPFFRAAGVPLTVVTGVGQEVRVSGQAGRGHVYLGTHALMGKKADLGELRLAVIDEQHRFGVSQRARLRGEESTDLLVMTATPIPRSLLLALYGDLDVSVLNELPPGRGEVDTQVLDAGDLPDLLAEMEREVAGGGRVFVVCPRIEETGSSGTAAAKTVARELKKRFRGEHGTALVHGKQTPADNAEALSRFRDGSSPVLVATVMVEVGLDVPSATMMVVLDAERFGLATLHQLRGRVGRGGADGSCRVVLGEGAKDVARDRLRILAGTTDGLRIAEEDLALRGPGAAFGQRQHGKLALRCAEIPRDLDLVARAREVAAATSTQVRGGESWPLPGAEEGRFEAKRAGPG